MKCSQCGKEFTVLYPDLWAYKTSKKWFCTWKCLRADEKKGEEKMPRMKKDGTPAKKPGPRKPKNVLENMPVDLERDMRVMERMAARDAQAEQQRQEMIGKTYHFQMDDKPLTAEERLSKYGMIPTRIETEDGLWETFGDYKGNETLVGFRIKKDHPFGPLGDHCNAIVMTVEDWHSVCDQMDMAMSMMKL